MNILRIAADSPPSDELLNVSAFGAGALIRVERSADNIAPYAEIGTLALVAGTYGYTYYDQVQATGAWYRTRYSNSGNTNQSSYGAVSQANISYATLCSLGDVKQRLGILATDTTDDERLLEMIAQESAWIQGKTHRLLLPDPSIGTKVYLFDGHDATDNGMCLPIPRGIQTVTQLRVALYTGGALAVVPATDYFLQPSVQELDPGSPYFELWMTNIPSAGNSTPYFGPGYVNIEVTGTFGWPATPLEIDSIAQTLSVAAWKARSSSGAESVMIGVDGSRIIEKSLSSQQWHTLQRFTLKSIEII